MRSVFVNSPLPTPEVILTNFSAEPTVLLVPITSRDKKKIVAAENTNTEHKQSKKQNIPKQVDKQNVNKSVEKQNVDNSVQKQIDQTKIVK